MTAFNNEKYLKLQAENINKRIEQFNNKLYLEFGGKIFDDYHASRVLPGFQVDSKVQMLLGLRDKVEVIIAISAHDIVSCKVRADNGVTYEEEVFRLIDAFKKLDLYVGSVVVTKYNKEPEVKIFERKLKSIGIPMFLNYEIAGYPVDTDKIVSEDGFGKNDYIKTTRSLIVVTAPGPGSGKMATCLSQLYHENKNGICAGYAKYETFPVWNLTLKHPVNLAYEAATADLDDVNMIDPFHYNAYNEVSVNYNRDVEVFPILDALFKKIYGDSPYKSPTDMGVNMAGFCLENEEEIAIACRQEVIRRYLDAKVNLHIGKGTEKEVEKIELIMGQIGTNVKDRTIVDIAIDKANKEKVPCIAIKLHDGSVITGKQSNLLTATSAALLNAIKYLASIKDKLKLISPNVIEPLLKLKTDVLHSNNLRLNAQDLLTVLSITAPTNPIIEEALNLLTTLKGTEAHSTVLLGYEDASVLKSLRVHLTQEATFKN
jgi:uncharacterized protein (UPF0371 family)